MVLRHCTYPTSFNPHQPPKSAYGYFHSSEEESGSEKLAGAGLSHPEHTGSAKARVSLTEVLSSQPQTSSASQSQKSDPTCPAQHRQCPPFLRPWQRCPRALWCCPSHVKARMLKITQRLPPWNPDLLSLPRSRFVLWGLPIRLRMRAADTN